MSIPKEPRALMINLMYLVLTAMLALNVSAEIINAFFMLDKGIKHTNEIVDKSTEATVEAMENTAKDKEHLIPIAKLAKGVPSKIDGLIHEVDMLRAAITNEGGLYLYKGDYHGKSFEKRKKYYEEHGIEKIVVTDDIKLEGKPKDKKNKDITQRKLVDEKMGAKLKELISKTRKDLLAVVDSAVAMANTGEGIEGVKFDSLDVQRLKDDLVLEAVDDKVWQDAEKASWEAHVFGYMPVAACYPLFRKYQNDAKNAAAQVVNFLSSNMGTKSVVYDKFAVFAQSQKPYILLGETYEAEIALGAFSSQADIAVKVGGRALNVEDGKAKFTARPSSVGTQSFKAEISVKNPQTGKVTVVEETFKYEVGVPSVTVAADKMNVFYIGVDNPISVSAAGVSSNDVGVSISGAGGAKLKPAGKGKYIVNATKMTKKGEYCNIVLTNRKTGKPLGSYPFRVKRIPNPEAQLANGQTDGVIKSAQMRVMRGLMAVLKNFDFDARCQIQGFTMFYLPPRQDAQEVTNQGGRFTGRALQFVQSARPGATFQFTNVKGRCPGDTAGRKLNGLAFQVKG